jgi:hypothetical protein
MGHESRADWKEFPPDMEKVMIGVRKDNYVIIAFGYIAYVDTIQPDIEHESGFAYRLRFDDGGDTSTVCGFQGPESHWYYK